MDESLALQCKNIGKNFQTNSELVKVLMDVNLDIEPGTSTAIMGSSGCGKSTLLHIMAGLERPSSGEIWIAGKNLIELDKRAVAEIRNKHLGFIYQFHHLLGDLTALENVIVPLVIGGMRYTAARRMGMVALSKVDLAEKAKSKPAYLSGGERQRVAVARALIHSPKCVLADEPTANLDRKNAEIVLQLLLKLCEENSSSLVLVTHDRDIAHALRRQVTLVDGSINEARANV